MLRSVHRRRRRLSFIWWLCVFTLALGLVAVMPTLEEGVFETTVFVLRRDLDRLARWIGGRPPDREDPRYVIRGKARSPQSYDGTINRAARMWKLDPAFIRAVIMTESAYDPGAVSKAGALGLMQLMPETAADLGVTNPLNPEENIMAGARLLRGHLDRYGSVHKALVAYNAGPLYVEKRRRPPPETRRYIRAVLYYYGIYREEP